MHKARAFFFVCLGILCIVAAYHLGARSAGAQTGGCITAAEFFPSGGTVGFAAIHDRTVYLDGAESPAGPVPGTSPIVAIGQNRYRGFALTVILGDGSIYEMQSTSWTPWGSVCGGPCSCAPTTAQSISIGQLKAKYATPAGK